MDFDNHPDHFTSKDEEPSQPAPEQPVSAGNETDPTIHFSPKEEAASAAKDQVKAHSRHRGRKLLAGSIFLLMAVLGAVAWVRYFNPYETDMTAVGYITDIKRQGYIFKTWEGDMAPAAADTHPASVPSCFSVADPAVAGRLQAYKDTGMRVKVYYRRYRATVPWRGASAVEITGVAPDPAE